MTISALRPLDARHVSTVATAAAKAPFLRGPGHCYGQEDWDENGPSSREGTPGSAKRQWGSPQHKFELPEVAMDPLFEDVWEDTVAAVGPLMSSARSSFETQRKAVIHQCEHASKSFQDAIQKNMPQQMSLPKPVKGEGQKPQQ